jgi:hypothetical protein
MDFIGTDTVLAIGNHPDSGQPLIQTKRRVLKNRSNFDAKLAARVNTLALPLTLIRKKPYIVTPARWTDSAIRPTSRGQVSEASILVREKYYRVLKCFRGGFVRHSEAILQI